MKPQIKSSLKVLCRESILNSVEFSKKALSINNKCTCSLRIPHVWTLTSQCLFSGSLAGHNHNPVVST